MHVNLTCSKDWPVSATKHNKDQNVKTSAFDLILFYIIVIWSTVYDGRERSRGSEAARPNSARLMMMNTNCRATTVRAVKLKQANRDKEGFSEA